MTGYLSASSVPFPADSKGIMRKLWMIPVGADSIHLIACQGDRSDEIISYIFTYFFQIVETVNVAQSESTTDSHTLHYCWCCCAILRQIPLMLTSSNKNTCKLCDISYFNTLKYSKHIQHT